MPPYNFSAINPPQSKMMGALKRLTPELPLGKRYKPANAPAVSYKKLVGNQPFRAGDAVLHHQDNVGRDEFGPVHRRLARAHVERTPSGPAKREAATDLRIRTQGRIDSGRAVNEDKAARGDIDRPVRPAGAPSRRFKF